MSNKTNSSISVKIIPLNEVLQVMHQDVLNFQEILKNDISEETVHNILEEIANYTIDERLPKNISLHISKMLDSDEAYSYERLNFELKILLEILEDTISFYQHEDNVEFVRTILKVMLKHADEVTRWLEKEIQ